jgi:hypothetical protein
MSIPGRTARAVTYETRSTAAELDSLYQRQLTLAPHVAGRKFPTAGARHVADRQSTLAMRRLRGPQREAADATSPLAALLAGR